MNNASAIRCLRQQHIQQHIHTLELIRSETVETWNTTLNDTTCLKHLVQPRRTDDRTVPPR